MKNREYKCPECGETFAYVPSEKARESIEQAEVTTGRAAGVQITCLHCPEALLLDTATGAVEKFVGSSPMVEDVGTIIWDMEATERTPLPPEQRPRQRTKLPVEANPDRKSV